MEQKIMDNSLILPTHLSNSFSIQPATGFIYWLMLFSFAYAQTSSHL